MTDGSDGMTNRRPGAISASLAGMLVVGILLQIYRPGAQSFWLDELWTVAASNPAIPLDRWMTEWILPDVHPPLYFFLVREWRLLFGPDEFSLRLMSVLTSLVLVAAVPAVQRWTPAVREPLWLTAWLACSVGAIVYAQEARPYALLLLLTTVATLLSVGIAWRMERNEPLLWPVCLLAAVVGLAEYSHYFGAIMGTGLFGALCLFAGIRHRRHLRTVVTAGAATIGALLPWLLFHALHISNKLGGDFWITNAWRIIAADATKLAAGSPVVFLLLVAAVAAVLAARPHMLRRPDCFVPLAAICLMLLAAAAISLHTPVVTARNLLILAPSFFVLAVTAAAEIVHGTGRPQAAIARLATVSAVAASLVFAGHRTMTDQKDQWREAAARVASLPGCRDATLQVYFWPEEIYAHYLPQRLRAAIRTVSIKRDDWSPAQPVARPDGHCPLIVWSGHMVSEHLVDEVVDRIGIDRSRVLVQKTKGNMLLLDRDRLLAAGHG